MDNKNSNVDAERMKEYLDAFAKANDIQQIPAPPCPSCGHCPVCGRGGYYFRPYYQPYPYYQPWDYYPQITWTSTGTNING